MYYCLEVSSICVVAGLVFLFVFDILTITVVKSSLETEAHLPLSGWYPNYIIPSCSINQPMSNLAQFSSAQNLSWSGQL